MAARRSAASASRRPGAPPAAPAGGGWTRRRRRRQPRDVDRSEEPAITSCSATTAASATSSDGGQTWRRADLPTVTVFSMAFDMDTPFRVYGSVQDHGSYRAADRHQRRPRELEGHSVGGRARRRVHAARGRSEESEHPVFRQADAHGLQHCRRASRRRRWRRRDVRRRRGGARHAPPAAPPGPQRDDEHPSHDRAGRGSAAHAGPGADPPLAARSRHRLLRHAVSLPLARSRHHVGTADGRPELRRQDQDSATSRTSSSSRSPSRRRRRGSSIPAPTTGACTHRWTTARSSGN